MGAAAVAMSALPRSAHAVAHPFSTVGKHPQNLSNAEARLAGPRIDDPAIKALALRAVDAAKSAGATYADARVTRTERQLLFSEETYNWHDSEELAIGVRALVNGYWGFAASAIWTNE